MKASQITASVFVVCPLFLSFFAHGAMKAEAYTPLKAEIPVFCQEVADSDLQIYQITILPENEQTPAPASRTLEISVEVEGRGDGRMSEDDRDGFIIAAACDTPGGEAVAESVEANIRDIKPPEQAVEIITIGPGFHRDRTVGYEEIFRRHYLL